MNDLKPDILHCIGNTSLLPLRKVVPGNRSRVLLKLEGENPTGSMKDRMALAMIEAGETDGRLKAGGSVVEYTGGSTGVSLSLICAVKGYPLHIVTSDAFAREKLDHMRLQGAKLKVVPSEGGRMTEKLTRDLIEAARIITAETGAFWTDQLNNADQLPAYHRLAGEIWKQTDGQIDGFVQSVGTGASLRGTAEGLRRHNAQIKIVAVEPAESPVLSGGLAGAHKIDGVGIGFMPPLWKKDVVDQIDRVSTEEASAMAMRLAREEGVFAGTFHRRKRDRRFAAGGSAGTGRHPCHPHVRYRNEIPEQITDRLKAIKGRSLGEKRAKIRTPATPFSTVRGLVSYGINRAGKRPVHRSSGSSLNET